MESGAPGWIRDGTPTDPHRWELLDASDPNGSAHSPSRSWRFGHTPTPVPNPSPGEWHALTSPPVPVSGEPAHLVYYHRYDLWGRTTPRPINVTDSDQAAVEVRYGGGPWTRIAEYAGRDLTWRGASFNLSANVTEPTTIQVRFNVTSAIMPEAGGWWVDDVMIAERGLGRAVVLLGSGGPFDAIAGGAARFNVKVANVGDFEDRFLLNATLPAGWTLVSGSLSQNVGESPLQDHEAVLAPDKDGNLRVVVRVPSTAGAGQRYTGTLWSHSADDAAATAFLDFEVLVADAVALPLDLILLIAVLAAALILGGVSLALRRRRPRT